MSSSKKSYFYIVFICFEKFSYYWVTYNGNSSLRPFYICDFTINFGGIDIFVYFFVIDQFGLSLHTFEDSKNLCFFTFEFPAIVLATFRCKLRFH